MKRLYEALFIFSSREDIYQKDLEAVKNLLPTFEIALEKDEDMAVKELAYPINKQTKGRYHVLYLSCVPTAIQKLRNELKLQETLMRYLIIEISKKDLEHMERKAKAVPREQTFDRNRHNSYRDDYRDRDANRGNASRDQARRTTSNVVRDFTDYHPEQKRTE